MDFHPFRVKTLPSFPGTAWEPEFFTFLETRPGVDRLIGSGRGFAAAGVARTGDGRGRPLIVLRRAGKDDRKRRGLPRLWRFVGSRGVALRDAASRRDGIHPGQPAG